MYLHYNVEPHYLKEKIEIFHPVGSEGESAFYAKQLMRNQNKGKTYSDFYLTDMTKKNIIKPYSLDEIERKQRVVKDNNYGANIKR